ncbi:MAG: ABC transporter ATP-binding protein [Vicinamibacterales bacterium]
MAAIALERIRKVYPNGHVAAEDLSLDIEAGELLVLVGPSGSGKSTVLRLIAGLEAPTAGRILIGGRDVTAVSPQERDLAMVFQNYALYPHKSVRENMAFGLRVRGTAPEVIAARVSQTAASLGIDGLLDRRPAQLSGGQRQRVALGRAIVREPQAFLLDEPLSNLDPLLRVGTRAELALLHRRLGATMVYVTHDQEEAMTLGTRIAVMNEGRIEQLAPPRDTFDRPATAFVARFVGSPAMNLWPGTLAGAGGRARVTTTGFEVEVETTAPAGPVQVGIRPHEVAVVEAGHGDAVAQVEVVEPLGATTTLHVAVEGLADGLARVVVPPGTAARPGDRIGMRLPSARLHLFDGNTGIRL